MKGKYMNLKKLTSAQKRLLSAAKGKQRRHIGMMDSPVRRTSQVSMNAEQQISWRYRKDSRPQEAEALLLVF